MSENEVDKENKSTKDNFKEKVKTNVYIKEKRNGTPTFVMVACTALIAGAVGSAGMYLALTKGNVTSKSIGSNK